MRRVDILLALAACTGVLSQVDVADAYEFRVSAATIGQGYQIRLLRFSEPDQFLNRRRLTQTLRLELWDLGGGPAHATRPRPPGPELYVSSYLRFDHDFGEYSAGEVTWMDRGVQVGDPATSVVGELDETQIQLDVPYAFLGGRDLFGFLDFRLGRQLEIDTWDFTTFDGLALVFHTPVWLDVELHGGLVVRDASFLGVADHEPDGTSGEDCRAFEEGSGGWIPRDDCAQREAWLPGFGVAVSTAGLRHVSARLAYRRVQSRAADIYPDGTESWGVNEEKLTADLHGELGPLAPYAAARWNFVLGQVDEAAAGVRLGLGDLALTPEASYSYPSFDADSIFNVFAAEAHRDAGASLDLWPGRGAWRGHARGYYRRFASDLGGEGAGGGEASVRWKGERGSVRLLGRHEDGFGGRQSGGDLAGSLVLGRAQLESRLTLVDYADPDSDRDGTSLGVQAGARVPLAPGTALHVLGEENLSDAIGQRFRLLVILDLAYVPEI